MFKKTMVRYCCWRMDNFARRTEITYIFRGFYVRGESRVASLSIQKIVVINFVKYKNTWEDDKKLNAQINAYVSVLYIIKYIGLSQKSDPFCFITNPSVKK